MPKELRQITWNDALCQELREIVRLAIREDLGDEGDVTSRALVPKGATGRAAVVARRSGVVAGLPAAEEAIRMVDAALVWNAQADDGRAVDAGQPIALVEGPALGLLAAERLALNVLGRLSGIATLTRTYVEAVAGSRARIYDTRKTTPGWRRLEKYAVRCGGGWNHRTGLYDAVLIKDNHLALGAEGADDPPAGEGGRYTPAQAVRLARRFAESASADPARGGMVVEIEVDTLDALEQVLPASPDVVLLDNMGPDDLRRAVAMRDAVDRTVQLEASGGVSLSTVAAIAASGVDRISVGALTHSAPCLDLGLDWLSNCSQ